MDSATHLESAPSTRVELTDNTAATIVAQWDSLKHCRDEAIKYSAGAARILFNLGEVFVAGRKQHPDFDAWLVELVPDLTSDVVTNCIRVRRKYSEVDPAQMEFAAIKELMQTAQILPLSPPQETPLPSGVWNFHPAIKHFDREHIAKLTPEDRRIFAEHLRHALAVCASLGMS